MNSIVGILKANGIDPVAVHRDLTSEWKDYDQDLFVEVDGKKVLKNFTWKAKLIDGSFMKIDYVEIHEPKNAKPKEAGQETGDPFDRAAAQREPDTSFLEQGNAAQGGEPPKSAAQG